MSGTPACPSSSPSGASRAACRCLTSLLSPSLGMRCLCCCLSCCFPLLSLVFAQELNIHIGQSVCSLLSLVFAQESNIHIGQSVCSSLRPGIKYVHRPLCMSKILLMGITPCVQVVCWEHAPGLPEWLEEARLQWQAGQLPESRASQLAALGVQPAP